jgi:hypothetical protein
LNYFLHLKKKKSTLRSRAWLIFFFTLSPVASSRVGTGGFFSRNHQDRYFTVKAPFLETVLESV